MDARDVLAAAGKEPGRARLARHVVLLRQPVTGFFAIETAPGALVFVLRGHCAHAKFVFPVEKKPWTQNSHSPSSVLRRPRPAMHLQSLLLVDPGADMKNA